MYIRKKVTEEEIKAIQALYYNLGINKTQLSRLFELSTYNISKYLKTDTPRIRTNLFKTHTNLKEIATILGIEYRYVLLAYNRTYNNSQELHKPSVPLKKIPRDFLYNEYYKKRRYMSEIAEELDISVSTVRLNLVYHGIPIRRSKNKWY